MSVPNDYVFWDGFHPTANAHKLAAEFIFKSVFSRRHHALLSGRKPLPKDSNIDPPRIAF